MRESRISPGRFLPEVEAVVRPKGPEWAEFSLAIRVRLPDCEEITEIERALHLKKCVKQSLGPHQVHSYSCTVTDKKGKIIVGESRDSKQWSSWPENVVRFATHKTIQVLQRKIQYWCRPYRLAPFSEWSSWSVTILNEEGKPVNEDEEEGEPAE